MFPEPKAPPDRPLGPRRAGDEIPIAGDYQYRALYEGSRVQRAWHGTKLALLEWAYLPRAGETVLDVGCGSGVFADAIARRGARVLAIDANKEAIDFGRQTFARDGLEFRRGYLDELHMAAASFDAAVCLEVIEHVHAGQVADMLSQLHRILRPGGRLLLTTPNYRGVWPIIEWLADRFAGTADMDCHQHVTRFHRRMLRRYLGEAGFAVESLRTFSTLAPFVGALSERLGRWCERLERRFDLPFGNILVAVARNTAR